MNIILSSISFDSSNNILQLLKHIGDLKIHNIFYNKMGKANHKTID